MSENPYQTPQTVVEKEKVGGSARFGLLSSTSSLAWVCVLLLSVNIFTTLLGLLLHFVIVEVTPSRELGVILSISTIIGICMWTSKSMINAWVSGEPLPTITPGWAAGWYFIPIACFWKPYQAIREIWVNLYGENVSKALPLLWWIFWLLNTFTQIFYSSLYPIVERGEKLELFSAVGLAWQIFRILSAIFLIMVILRVTRGHQERINQKY